ncbi:MAG: hypothetical protein V3S45_01520, partial [Kiloniellales bacterium]
SLAARPSPGYQWTAVPSPNEEARLTVSTIANPEAAHPGWARVVAAATERGLIVFGGFHPGEDDGVPPLANGRTVGTLCLLGNAGAAMWTAFRAAPEAADGRPDPLERWSERVLGALAAELGGQALFPFGGPPYRPFVAWAKRAQPVSESPIGILIHPDYGLWHAYRGALAFADAIELPPPDRRPRPCDACPDKPCLSTCPVAAFAPSGYDVGACTGHLTRPEGGDCLGLGCRARRACPVGRGYIYEPDQAELHMRAFLKARLAAES